MEEFVIKDGVLLHYRGNCARVVVPEGVHTIDMLAFSKESKMKLESIQLPESLKVIEDWALDHCDKLTQVVIPANVRQIGKGAFNWCRALRNVVIEGDPKIGEGAFGWSPWDDEEFRKAGARIDGNTLLRVHPDLTEYTIPPHITVIGRDAFKGCKVREVIVPEGVTMLDICAFAYSAVERVVLPESLKRIRAYAFSNCENLRKLIIPKSVESIDKCAFAGTRVRVQYVKAPLTFLGRRSIIKANK